MDMDNELNDIISHLLNKYNDMKIKDAFEIILKLLENILKRPNEQKFRFFKKSNEIIKSKVLIMKEFVTLMKTIGYTDIDENLMMYSDENNFNKIKNSIELINNYQKVLIEKSKEYDKSHELLELEEIKRHNEENKRIYEEEKHKQQIILAQIVQDQKERKEWEHEHTL